MRNSLKNNLLIISLFSVTAYAADLTTSQIDVISQTPLPSVGIDVNQLPSTVQKVKAQDIKNSQSLDISNYMNENLTGVFVNNVQGNPLQMDVNYRGFTASPLLGTPQGMSVYMDGVRMNQPFGDVISWDLIPKNAISGMQLYSGSNPLFGLNTLGGALSIQTKDGRSNEGGALQFTAGSWGRKIGEFEYGGVSKDNSVDYFLAGTWFNEDGWREHSSSDNKQLFGKLGWQGEKTTAKLTMAYSDSNLKGMGLTPNEMLTNNYNSVFTWPDNTKNKSYLANLQLERYLTDNLSFSGNAYYKKVRTNSLNGDYNNDHEDTVKLGTYTVPAAIAGYYLRCNAVDAGGALKYKSPGNEPGQKCEGLLTYNYIYQDSKGIFGQFDVKDKILGFENKFVAGGGVDYSEITYNRDVAYATLDASRQAVSTGFFADPTNGLNFNLDDAADDQRVRLTGTTWTWSAYGTDTLSLTEKLHLTGSARYNHVSIHNNDTLIPSTTNPKSLSGDHEYNRVNPAIGLAFAANPAINFYGGYNEGSRAPTAMELGCASSSSPCKLPNAMAGDPSLKQVITKTWEGGVRGKFDLMSAKLGWNASLYASTNYDDIQFISADASGKGYFNNVGETSRRGFDGLVSGNLDKLFLMAGYSYIDAKYETSQTRLSSQNASANTDGLITVSPGNQIPLIPHHTFKLSLNYAVLPKLNIGATGLVFSSAYANGNENNQDPNGKIPGYGVLNLNSNYVIDSHWSIFARADNIFDKNYYTAGQLGSSPFDANGNMTYTSSGSSYKPNDHDTTFYAPGSPLAGWVGMRYEFGSKKSSSSD